MDTTILLLLILGVLTVTSVVALVHALPLDGYRRLPDDTSLRQD